MSTESQHPKIEYGIRPDKSAWISVGDPLNGPHAQCDVDLPEWALKALDAKEASAAEKPESDEMKRFEELLLLCGNASFDCGAFNGPISEGHNAAYSQLTSTASTHAQSLRDFVAGLVADKRRIDGLAKFHLSLDFWQTPDLSNPETLVDNWAPCNVTDEKTNRDIREAMDRAIDAAIAEGAP